MWYDIISLSQPNWYMLWCDVIWYNIIISLVMRCRNRPMTVTNIKRLKAAHHRWQVNIFGITRKDKIRNEEVRKKTGLCKLENIIRKNRQWWCGHIKRMEEDRIPTRVLSWNTTYRKRKRGSDKDKLDGFTRIWRTSKWHGRKIKQLQKIGRFGEDVLPDVLQVRDGLY